MNLKFSFSILMVGVKIEKPLRKAVQPCLGRMKMCLCYHTTETDQKAHPSLKVLSWYLIIVRKSLFEKYDNFILSLCQSCSLMYSSL